MAGPHRFDSAEVVPAVMPVAFVKLLADSLFPPVPQSSRAWGCALGVQAYVFAGRIQQAVERTSISFPRALGHIMAPELGHDLLGEKSHALGSIMSPELGEWEFRQMRWGALLFNPAHSARMRERIRALQTAETALPPTRSDD